MGSPVLALTTSLPVFSDWGDSMWAEIHQDWDDTDEESVANMTARYLHAWADVSRIGTVSRHDNEKLQEGIVSKAKQEINNNRKVERRKIPTRSRRPSRQRF